MTTRKSGRKGRSLVSLVSTDTVEKGAAKLGLTDGAILARLRGGWSVKDALTTPKAATGRPRDPRSFAGKARAAGLKTARAMGKARRRIAAGMSTGKALAAAA